MGENLGLQVEIGANIKPLTKGLADARKELASTAAAAGKTDSSIGKLGSGLTSFGGAASSAKNQISGLASSFISGGLITGITLAGVALIELGKSLFDVSEHQKKFNSVIDESKSSYVKAVLEVDKMRDAFEKAKTGVISKESALKLYNGTIGKTIGQTNDLDTAEKNFIANAENYVRYTFLKAAANIALGKAAEAAFRAEAERQKGPVKPTFLERFSFSKFGGPSNEKLLQNRINKELKEQNSFLEIYNGLKDQANKFEFSAIKQGEKEVVVIKKKTEAVKEFLKIKRSGLSPQIEAEVPLSLASGSTIEPTITIKPKIEFIVDPAQQKKVLDGIRSLIDSEAISGIIQDSVQSAVTSAADSFAGILTGTKNGFSTLFDGLASTLAQGLKSIGQYLVKTYLLIGVIEKIKFSNPAVGVAVGFALQVLGALIQSKISQTKAFATGVRNFGGGLALVGERGPELVDLPKGAGVRTNAQFNAMGGSQVFIPELVIRGTDLVAVFKKATAQNARNGF